MVFVLVSIILGVIIISKYFKYTQVQLILVGFSWIFLVSPYWPDAISFVLILTTGKQLAPQIYFFLACGFTAPIYFTWLKVFTTYVLKNQKKAFVISMITVAIVYEIAFLIVFFSDYTLIGTQKGPFYVEYSLFIDIYLLVSIVMFTVTGILFARQSLKTENEEIRLKGKFLIFAFVLFATGTTIDVAFELTEITLVLARAFVIVAAFAFYIGFTLPKPIKNLFIKVAN